MKVAILGATSLIAQDLIRQWNQDNSEHELYLYARNMEKLSNFLLSLHTNANASPLSSFPDKIKYDVIINFIGAGDPTKIREISNSIISITNFYDDLIINYLKCNGDCKYIFLSSGAVYGSNFKFPASESKKSEFLINNVKSCDFYALSKFLAEIKHRELSNYSIIDLRVFNYFSRFQSINDRFFITDLVRSIKRNECCDVSPDSMTRDYIHPEDFRGIIDCLIKVENVNQAVDCYSASPINKPQLLVMLEQQFGLKWKYSTNTNIISATHTKECYYSEYYALKKFGYSPKYTSAQTLNIEISALL